MNIDGEVSNTFTIPLNESYLNKFIRLTVVSTDINSNTTEFESLSYKITNYLPVFDSNPVTNATEDTEYTYEINVSDEDLSGNLDLSENITIRSTTLPSWLTLKDRKDNTAILSGIPSQANIGNNLVVLEAEDYSGNTSNQTFTIVVSNVNDVPTFSSTAITSATEDSLYVYNITISEEDLSGNTDLSENVVITATTIPEFLTLTDNGDHTATLTGTPLQAHLGENSVVLVATDASGASTTQEFTITVANVNDVPTFSSTAITSATEDSLYVYNITISEEDLSGNTDLSENVVITATTIPEFLTLTDNGDHTATLTGTPLQAHLGENSVVLVATDASGASTTQEFTITVANVNDVPTFSSTAITSATEDSLYVYNITISEEDLSGNTDLSENVVITATTIPEFLTLTDNGDHTATLTGTPLQAHLGENSVVLVATDSSGASTTQEFTITVTTVAPTFSSTAITNATEDSLYLYNITISEEDLSGNTDLSENVIITASTIPEFLTLTDNGDHTATLTGTPLQAHLGENSVVLVATDASGASTTQEFTITVANVNDVPTFSSTAITSATEDSLYVYNITILEEDLSGNTDLSENVVITATTIPEFLTLTDNGDHTATLTGTPLQAHLGENSVVLVATDASGASTTQEFTITVANVNDVPTFSSTAITSATEDSLYVYNITILEEDLSGNTDLSENVVITATTIPEFLTLTDNGDHTATLTGTPLQAHLGENSVVLVATDASGASTTQEFTITVANVNDVPTFSSTAITSATEDSLYVYNITISEEDLSGNTDLSENVVITATTIPEFLTLTDNGDHTATLTGTPLQAHLGENSVVLVATDASGASITQEFTITVANVNDVPTFSSTAITSATEDSLYVYNITISEEDLSGNTDLSENIVITATTIPEFLTLTDNGDHTATLTGTPLQTHLGENSVVLVATDASGASTTQEFTITVANVNDVPTFSSTAVTSATEDSLYVYNITISEEDLRGNTDLSENVVITATTIPEFLTLTDNGDHTATLTGTPLQAHLGENSVVLVATDASGASTTQEFTITVANVNDVPTFSSTAITSATEDSLYVYNITISEEDLSGNTDLSENVVITATTIPEFLTLTDNGDYTATLTGTPLQAHVGENSVVLVATDASGASTTQEFTITVANVEDEATGVLSFTGDSKEGGTLTADISDIKDEDTNNEALTFTFQWQLGDDTSNFNDIDSGGTDSSFTIPSDQSYVDKYIRLTAISEDDRGGTTSFISSSKLIENVEDEATGVLSFTGDSKEGGTLTADISDIKDEDTNNEALTFTFQWQLGDDTSNFNDIDSGGTDSSFTIPSDQSYVDKYIRLTAISEDDRGGTTSFISSSKLIENVNDLPTFSSTPVTIGTEDSEYKYDIIVTDEDGENLQITSPILPSWLTFTDNGNNTGTLIGTPLHENNGINVVKLRVTDNAGEFEDQDFTINIFNNPNFENLQLISSDSINSNVNYLISMDDTNVTISLVNNTYEWLSIENGVLTGVLPDTFIENIEFQIKVMDNSNGNSRIYTYQLDITPNARPVLQDLQLILDSGLSKNYIAPYFDTDNDDVTFSIELSDSSITWVTIDSNTGVISGTPPDDYHNNSGDPVIITVTASDGKISVQKQFTLVVERNDVPTVNELQLISYDPSENKYIVPYFDTDTTELEIMEGPAWVSLTNNGGNYSLTTNSNFTDDIFGEFDLKIKFTDVRFGVTIKEMSIKIQQEPIVKSDAITTLTISEESTEQEIELTDIFGPDGLSFTYDAISNDTNKITTSINGSKLILSLVENAFGEIIITTSAFDGLNTTNHDIEITINNVEDDASGNLLIIGDAKEGATLTANTDNIEDNDGSLTFTFQWQLGDDTSSFDDIDSNISGAISSEFTIPSDQSYVDKFIRVTAISTDSIGGTTSFISSSKLIVNVEDEATGTLSFTGDVQEGATLTAYTSNIKDVDTNNEPLTFTFQWQLADDSSSFDSNSNISGATNSTFTNPI